jgi:hypothetical protein
MHIGITTIIETTQRRRGRGPEIVQFIHKKITELFNLFMYTAAVTVCYCFYVVGLSIASKCYFLFVPAKPTGTFDSNKVLFSICSCKDDRAVWVMQGWLFLDQEFWGEEQASALLTAVGQLSCLNYKWWPSVIGALTPLSIVSQLTIQKF